MRPMMSSSGLTCRRCQAGFVWADIPFRIEADGEGGLVWVWVCPIDAQVIRSEPFAFPPDYVAELEDVG